MDDALRQANAAVAALYDAVPYDPRPSPWLEPERLMGLAALYGCDARLGDVLDLGCGAGVELARTGPLTRGRVIGADLSGAAVARARAQCAPLGARCDILHADLFELEAAALGAFDLILSVGVLYLTPPEVRRRLLQLIGQCLRPGGVAALTWYAGPAPAVRADLHRRLRQAVAGVSPGESVAQARAELAALAAGAARGEPQPPWLTEAVELTASQNDANLFHELFDPTFEVLTTAEIEAALAREGLSFLTFVDAPGVGAASTSRQRALGADAHDAGHGGYHHALFGRPAADTGPNVRAANLRWHVHLRRRGELGDYGAVANPDMIRVRIGAPLSQAAVDALIARPGNWDSAVAAAGGVTDQHQLNQLETDLLALWQAGAAEPFGEV